VGEQLTGTLGKRLPGKKRKQRLYVMRERKRDAEGDSPIKEAATARQLGTQ